MVAERFPGFAILPDEDKMTPMAELWKDVIGDALDDNPVLAEFVEQRWQEYERNPDRVSLWSEVRSRIVAYRIDALPSSS